MARVESSYQANIQNLPVIDDIEIEVVIGQPYQVVKGTLNNPITGLDDGSTQVICDDFVGKNLRIVWGTKEIPSIDPLDTSNFYTRPNGIVDNFFNLDNALANGEWVKIVIYLSNPLSGPVTDIVNIYNSDGTLDESRTLNGNGNSLTFAGLSQFVVDGDEFIYRVDGNDILYKNPSDFYLYTFADGLQFNVLSLGGDSVARFSNFVQNDDTSYAGGTTFEIGQLGNYLHYGWVKDEVGFWQQLQIFQQGNTGDFNFTGVSNDDSGTLFSSDTFSVGSTGYLSNQGTFWNGSSYVTGTKIESALDGGFTIRSLNSGQNDYLDRLTISGSEDQATVHILNSKLRIDDGTQSDGYVLTCDGSGVASWASVGGNLNLQNITDNGAITTNAITIAADDASTPCVIISASAFADGSFVDSGSIYLKDLYTNFGVTLVPATNFTQNVQLNLPKADGKFLATTVNGVDADSDGIINLTPAAIGATLQGAFDADQSANPLINYNGVVANYTNLGGYYLTTNMSFDGGLNTNTYCTFILDPTAGGDGPGFSQTSRDADDNSIISDSYIEARSDAATLSSYSLAESGRTFLSVTAAKAFLTTNATTGVHFGIGTNAPAVCSLVDLTSTTSGLLLPRMTKTQRNAISTPLAGLAIYQTDNTPGLRVYNGTNWMKYTETTD